MKRRNNKTKLQKFIINNYNDPEKRTLLIKSLNSKDSYNRYKHEDLVQMIFRNLNSLVLKVVCNQPITETEKEFIEDAFIILSRTTIMRNKNKNLAVLMNNYFTKYPMEKVDNFKNRNLTFLNVVSNIVMSNKVGGLSVRLLSTPMIVNNKEISGKAVAEPNNYRITMYSMTDIMFEDEENYYAKIYDFLHEFGHILQYRKRTKLSKTELFDMENKVIDEDNEMYYKYYSGFETEFEANCIAKELIDILFDNNPKALSVAKELFESDKEEYEKNLEEFLGYIKRTYSFKLKRD